MNEAEPRPAITKERAERLSHFLAPVLEKYHQPGFIQSDPLRYAHRYENPLDRELVALVSAALAYGNVGTIFGSIERVLPILGPSPSVFLKNTSRRELRRRLSGFRHRFNSGDDVLLLLHWIALAQERHGSLGVQFSRYHLAGALTTGPALSAWVRELLAGDCTPVYPRGKLPAAATVRFFLSDPADGSACKRMNLFLRWMVRDDGIDLGLWRFVRPGQLVLPLDAHLSRIARYLGLTRRATNGWQTALEATASLRLLDPADPLKYDFALCRLGILKDCPARPDREVCRDCMLLPVCRAGASRTRVQTGGKKVQNSEAMMTEYAARPSEPI